MARILFSADWHIKLGQKNVPKAWQINRFHALLQELNQAMREHECTLLVLGGDTFDKYDPSIEEIELYFELISQLEFPTQIFSGNHELKNKTHSVLDNLAEETNRCNPLVSVVSNIRGEDYDIVDYAELHKPNWKPQKSRLCFTHVRAEFPHTTPEIDLTRFDCYDLVLAGDLHSYQCSQQTTAGTHILYPGSPLTTSFHRERTSKANGYIIINTETLNYSWHELGHLPQLVRKTITDVSEMVEDKYDRVIYEVEGSIDQLKKLKDSDLLDKKIAKNVSKDAVLNLNNLNISEELQMYLEKVKGLDSKYTSSLLARFKEVLPNADSTS